jgi:glutamate 5-kinase
LITRVESIAELDELEQVIQVGQSATSLGTGGMRTKLQAARIALEAGIECHIANTNKIYGVLFGETAHTELFPGSSREAGAV